MEQNPWKADSCVVSQEIPWVLWNLNLNYGIKENTPLVTILNHVNPSHILESCLFNTYFNIIPTAPGSSWWSLQVSLLKPVCLSLGPILLHTLPTLSSLILTPEYYWWIQMTKLLIVQFSPVSRHFVPLKSRYLLQNLTVKLPQRMFFVESERPGFAPIQKNRHYISTRFNLSIVRRRSGRQKFRTEWYETLPCRAVPCLAVPCRASVQSNVNFSMHAVFTY
jgi:hypothetical protein